MPHPQSALRFIAPGGLLANMSTVSRHGLNEVADHTINTLPLQNPEIEAWIQKYESHIGGLVFIFVFLLVLSGLWRSRRDMLKWYVEKSRQEERREWMERERMKRRSVVVVGILRDGKSWAGRYGDTVVDGGDSDGRGRPVKRVRFLGLDGVIGDSDGVRAGEERVEVVVDFLEDGRVVEEVF